LNKKVFRILYLLPLFFILLNANGQTHSIRISKVSDEQGNIPNSTSAFVQDKNGFIWFGTIDGLYRFDGYNFKIYKTEVGNPYSISSNLIRALAIDNQGSIWIGTQGGGLNRYNPVMDNFTVFKHNSLDNNSLCDNNIWALAIDKEQNIWIGTWGGGLDKFDVENHHFTHYKYIEKKDNSISENDIRTLFLDSNNNLWIGTQGGGLNFFDTKKLKFKFYKHNKNDINSLANNSVYSIIEKEKDKLWIGTNGGGIEIFDTKKEIFTRFSQNYLINPVIFSIKIKKNGTAAIATEKGLFLLTPDKQIIEINSDTHKDLINNRLRALLVDNDDNLWIGSESGINKLVENDAFIFFTERLNDKNGLSGKIIRSVYEDKEGNLWIGTLGAGLNFYSFENKQFTYIPFSLEDHSLLGSEITSIFEDSLNNFWVTTWNKGVFLFDKKKMKTIKNFRQQPNNNSLSDNRVQTIIEERKGIYWISTENGLNRFDLKQNLWQNFYFDYHLNSVSGNKFQSKSLVIDKNGVIWAGTWASGLNAIVAQKNNSYKIIHFKNILSDESSISSNSVISIYLDSKQNLWIGTFGGGINVLAPQEYQNLDKRKISFSHYTTDNGLVNNIVYGILEDKSGNMWFSTDKGLSMLNTKTKIFKNYTQKSGLLNDQFFWGASSDSKFNQLYFGTIEGLMLIKPKKIKPENELMKIELTDIIFMEKNAHSKFQKSLENVNINNIKYLEIKRENAFFTVKFVALNYNISSDIQYAYKLKGFDNDWNFLKKNKEITFSNLPQGEFELYVKALKPHSKEWTEEVKLLTFNVLPLFWETRWFFISVAIFIIFLAIVFYKVRIKNYKKLNLALEEKVNERTRELFEKNYQLQLTNENIAKKIEEVQLQKEKTERINKELNDFAYIISHDLKAPLRGISQLATWISMDYADKFDQDGQNQFVMLIERVKTMDKMIEGVLQYSRATNFVANFEKMDLNLLLKEILDLFLPSDYYDIIIENQLPSLVADKVRIMQVFQNLISNAIKYLAKEKGRILIRSKDMGTHWQFSISDNGIGIDAKYHETIFKIFQTIESSHNSDSTGIGLSIVKRIVNIYKGSIWVESEIGKGSTFFFTISKNIN